MTRSPGQGPIGADASRACAGPAGFGVVLDEETERRCLDDGRAMLA